MEQEQKQQLMIALVKKDMSLPKLSKESGIPISTLYDRVNGEHPFDYNQMVAIKEAMQLNMEQFLLIFPFKQKVVN